jgi:hypothetical protein
MHKLLSRLAWLFSVSALVACSQSNLPASAPGGSLNGSATSTASTLPDNAVKKKPAVDLFAAYGISGNGGVAAFKSPYSGAPIANMQGLEFPVDMAMDSRHDLFVADPYGYLTMWKPPYRSETIVVGSAGYGAVLVGVKNELFVANTGGSGGVFILKPPYKKASGEIVDRYTNYPSALAMDNKHGLFVVNKLGGNVAYYPSPYRRASAAILGLNLASSAQAIAIDANRTLFVTNGSNIRIYKPPYKSNSFQTIVTGIAGPEAIAVTPGGELFVANDAATAAGYGNVAIYKAPYNAPFKTIAGASVNDPQSVAVTPKGQLFIGNLYGGASDRGFVSVFNPPYSRATANATRNIGGGVNYVFLGP